MIEEDLLGTVLDMCKVLHLFVHHCRPARTAAGWRTPIQGTAGFVDLVICGREDVLFRELKSATGKPSPEQQAWMDRLFAAGANVGLWRPADLTTGRIESQLKAVR